MVGLLAAAWRRRFPWYPGDWIWPALLFLVVAVAATAISAATTSSSGTTIVATEPNVTVGPGTVAQTSSAPPSTLPSAPKPTVTTGPLPKAPGPPTTGLAGLATWPAVADAYTDVLASIPYSSGRAIAIARARQAKSAHLPRAGVLVSSDYPSLHPGYYVVFSGVYRTSAAAVTALAAAHARGFRDAYVARVTNP